MAAKVWSHKTIVERFEIEMFIRLITCTGNSLSEALIFESINPKCCAKRLLVELRIQYKKTTSRIVMNVKTSPKNTQFDVHNLMYRKVASRSTSRLIAPPRIFRLFMKGKLDAYVL